MDYKNIFKLQSVGYSFDEAKEIDKRGIIAADREALVIYEEEQEAKREHEADLEERGFYFGTDCPLENERHERSEAWDDRYQMYLNEY